MHQTLKEFDQPFHEIPLPSLASLMPQLDLAANWLNGLDIRRITIEQTFGQSEYSTSIKTRVTESLLDLIATSIESLRALRESLSDVTTTHKKIAGLEYILGIIEDEKNDIPLSELISKTLLLINRLYFLSRSQHQRPISDVEEIDLEIANVLQDWVELTKSIKSLR